MICELSIVMPCLNEAETLAICIKKAQQFFQTTGISENPVLSGIEILSTL